MALNHRGGRLDARIIRAKRLEQPLLLAVSEQLVLQRIERGGDIILAVEIGILKHFGEDIFGEDMLDQHFLDIILAHRRVDRIARMGEEIVLCAGEIAGCGALFLNNLAQAVENSGQIDLELGNRLFEIGDLRAFVREISGKQCKQGIDIVHRRTADFVAILIQNRSHVV